MPASHPLLFFYYDDVTQAAREILRNILTIENKEIQITLGRPVLFLGIEFIFWFLDDFSDPTNITIQERDDFIALISMFKHSREILKTREYYFLSLRMETKRRPKFFVTLLTALTRASGVSNMQ